MDEKLIIKMYVDDDMTLREISRHLSTNHKLIARILRKNNIEIIKKKSKPLTKEHKINIGKARKRIINEGKYIPYNKGLKMKNYICKNGVTGKQLLYNNMEKHLRFNIDIDWLLQFEDIEKLKFLNKSISRNRDHGNYDKQYYITFINKLYYDKNFNNIYNNWINSNYNYHLRPSVDHIIPKSKGGKLYDINNVQFLTWFENRCKTNLTQNEWNDIKKNINKYFI